MPYFQNILDRLGLGSSLNQEANAYRTATSGLSLAERLDRQRMSPNTRTKAWLDSHPTPKNHRSYGYRSKSPNVLGVTGGKVAKQTITPKSNFKLAPKSSSTSATKSLKFRVQPITEAKRFRFWNILPGFRNNTRNNGASPPRNESPSPPKNDDHYDGSTLIEEEETVLPSIELEGDTVVQDQEGDLHKADEHDFSDFTQEEYFLFRKINARGFEPILNVNWHWHFRTFPVNLFTNDPTKAYISHIGGPEIQGIKVLRGLIDLGVRVRERFELKQAPEKPLHDAITKYFKWTMQDTGLDKKQHVPVLNITCAQKGESAASLIGRCTDRLHALGRQYREMWRVNEGSVKSIGEAQRYVHELPTLFGIVIKFSVVGFVTYDSHYPGKAVRTMGNWDFSLEGQDVWHAFAVAIYIICARNYLMALDEEGFLGPKVQEDSDDPDA